MLKMLFSRLGWLLFLVSSRSFVFSEDVCVSLVLFPWGWNDAEFKIVDDVGEVLMSGSHDESSLNQNFEFCGRVGCYSMVVTKPLGGYAQYVSWRLGDDLEGKPWSTTEFFLSREGVVTEGCESLAPTMSHAPTVSKMPTSFPTLPRPCFELLLANPKYPGAGWDGAFYFVTTGFLDVIKNGTLELYAGNRTDYICVPEAPACYNFRVSDSESRRNFNFWSLAGNNMYEGDFYVSESGRVTIDGPCTNAPTVSNEPTFSPIPSASPTIVRTCFAFTISCYFCDIDDHLATIQIADSRGRLVAQRDFSSNGNSFPKLVTDLCVLETSKCYGLEVASNISDLDRQRLAWSLDTFETGVVPFSGAFFVSDIGNLTRGCSTLAPTSETPVPSYFNERIFILKETCLSLEDCLLTFDVVPEREVSSKALLTIDIDGPFDEAYEVAGVFIQNTTFFATCRGDYCSQSTCLDNVDVTDFLSSKMTLSILADFLLEDQSCQGDTWPYLMHIQATLKIIIDDEAGENRTLKRTSLSSLFSDLERGLIFGEEEEIMTFERKDVVYFDHPLKLVSMSRSIRNATFDGAMKSSFFSLEGANLSLSDLTLQHGRTRTIGGCVDARQGSRLALFRVVIENCAAKAFGGAFAFLDASFLFASGSKFLRNAAPLGGVACVSLSSTLFDFFALGFCCRRRSKSTTASSSRTSRRRRPEPLSFRLCRPSGRRVPR